MIHRSLLFLALVLISLIVLTPPIMSISQDATNPTAQPKTNQDRSQNSHIDSLTRDKNDLSDKVDRWNKWYIGALLVTLIVGAFGAFAQLKTIRLSRRLVSVQDQIEGEKDRRSARELAAVQGDAAKANERAGDANKEAGKATERAAKAEERAATAASHLAAAQRDTAVARREAAEASTKAEGFRLDIAKANESAKEAEARVAEANLELVKLRKQSKPRRLTGAQKEELRRRLESKRVAIAITSRIMDSESADFADDFATVLESAGWDVVRVRNRISSSKYGVFVGTTKDSINSPDVKGLGSAIRLVIGIDCPRIELAEGDSSMTPPVQARVLYLMVEQHPLIEQSSR